MCNFKYTIPKKRIIYYFPFSNAGAMDHAIKLSALMDFSLIPDNRKKNPSHFLSNKFVPLCILLGRAKLIFEASTLISF